MGEGGRWATLCKCVILRDKKVYEGGQGHQKKFSA